MSDARPAPRRRAVLLSILSGACALLLVLAIVRSPGEAFRASLAGLQVWWQTVFPGLLPPLMLAELLAASGLLHGLSAICEPVTRRLFRLPGAAGWAVFYGWISGLPTGAREAARLRDEGLVRNRDLDTLLLLAHQPNPFVVILVVGSGFLQAPAYGWALVAGLWLSALIAGAVWARLPRSAKPDADHANSRATPVRPGAAVRRAREEDGRPFGRQISDAVTRAVGMLMAIGGLMMISSVLLRMIQIAWPQSDAWLAVPGLYELHLGAYDASRSPLFEASPVHAVSLLAAVLAWTGWSGLLQARAAFGPGPGFPWGRFIAGRLLQAALAVPLTFPLARAVQNGWLSAALPAFGLPEWPLADRAAGALPLPSGWTALSETTLASAASIAVFLLLALLAAIIRPSKRRPRK
ncbi:nucleoside recognition domain-containing protein [Cohnella zeiphila]|uniref:Nucleoside recognition domain-containing protein n=1 Tax=Cohnella zeiphila TaxID=2761120 RepID=A0A7X0SUR9_9BACL|nr:nucleoside recognition domain-containing protein [Cohnella zeiphila]MBB6735524.1 nucleoside recognition domain-containing protein [Cohnella zeiphila]